MGKGRPRKAGPRAKSGRLVQLVDRGNDRVRARTATFHRFQGGKADQQLWDPIGRAWAVGLLDGTTLDPAILREAGRRYGRLYWLVFARLAPKMGATERADSSFDGGDEDPNGHRFARIDELTRSLDHKARVALHSLCVDDWWFPDGEAAWLGRIIADETRGGKAVRLATDADRMTMQLARHALASIVDGREDAMALMEIAKGRLTGRDRAA